MKSLTNLIILHGIPYFRGYQIMSRHILVYKKHPYRKGDSQLLVYIYIGKMEHAFRVTIIII